MRTGSAVGCRSSGHGAQEAENIGKDETDKDLSGRFPLWPPLSCPRSPLLLPLVMECYLSRRAPKAKQRWDGDCNDLSGCIADKPYTRALEVSAEPWMI